MIHKIIPPLLFQTHSDFGTKKLSNVIFLTFVVKFSVRIPDTLGKNNGNVAWKLEKVVTTLIKQQITQAQFSPITSKRDTS